VSGGLVLVSTSSVLQCCSELKFVAVCCSV